MQSTARSRDNRVSMSEEEVPAGPPAWPGGARTERPVGVARAGRRHRRLPAGGRSSTTRYEPPPPPRRTSRLVDARAWQSSSLSSARARPPPRSSPPGPRWLREHRRMSSAAIVDIDTSLGGGAAAAGTGMVLTSYGLDPHQRPCGRAAARRSASSSPQPAPRTPRRSSAQDSLHDIAVLQLQGATGLSTAPMGDSSTVQVGDNVTALGNARGRGGAPAVATGSVTALDQQITASDRVGPELRDPERHDPDQRSDPARRLGGAARQRGRAGDRHGHGGERRAARTRARSRSRHSRSPSTPPSTTPTRSSRTRPARRRRGGWVSVWPTARRHPAPCSPPAQANVPRASWAADRRRRRASLPGT